MKNFIPLLALCALGPALSGCIVIEKSESPPGMVVVPQTSEDSVAVAEIDAAGKLDFDQSRVTALSTIAARTNLSVAAQVRLVDTVFKRVDLEQSKMQVLEVLIKNPSFSNPAKQTLLSNLNKLSFDQSKAALLRMLNDRGELKA